MTALKKISCVIGHSASLYAGVKFGFGELYVYLHLIKSVKFVRYHSNYKNLNKDNTNLSPTELEGRAGEYWPSIVFVRTSLRSLRTATISGQYSPVRLELVRIVSSLLDGTRAMLVFGNK